MSDAGKLMQRQTTWQRQRSTLTWPEKIRMAEAVREWAARFSKKKLEQALKEADDGAAISREEAKKELFSK